MKILSRNVNGIRAVLRKGLIDFLEKESPDIFCIQETKAFEHQLPAAFKNRLHKHEYDRCRHAGERPGYAGTAIFRKRTIDDVVSCNTFDQTPMFYEDGRVTQIDFDYPAAAGGTGNTALLNIYFPNGGTRADGTEMLTYKLEFYDHLITYIQQLQADGKQVIVVGDYNICHTEIDIARPEANKNSIGFLPIEREKVSELLEKAQMTDIFRHFHPDQVDEYTWWSYRGGARSRNVWRRIDYMTTSSWLIDMIDNFRHRQDVMGSDHCPVEMVFSTDM